MNPDFDAIMGQAKEAAHATDDLVLVADALVNTILLHRFAVPSEVYHAAEAVEKAIARLKRVTDAR